MSKLLGFCVLVVLISSSNGFGQSTNKEAEEALRKGNNAGQNNDLSTAIINFTKAIELDPKYANAYFNRGIAYSNLKKYPEAIADYTKAIELDPKYADAYYNRGGAYKALGKTKEANADFAKTKELEK